MLSIVFQENMLFFNASILMLLSLKSYVSSGFLSEPVLKGITLFAHFIAVMAQSILVWLLFLLVCFPSRGHLSYACLIPC